MVAFFDAYDEDAEWYDLLVKQAKEKAAFCMATGVAPSEYEQLTQIEINEFVREANKRAKKGAM